MTSEATKKISLVFDATVITYGIEKGGNRTGIFFVAYNILLQLLKRIDINLTLYCKESEESRLKKFIGMNENFKNIPIIDEYDLELLNNRKGGTTSQKIDVFLSPMFKIPESILREHEILKFTIIYDLIPMILSGYSSGQLSWFKPMINSINKNDYYFSISENTKKDLVRYIPKIDSRKITVIPLAAADNFYQSKDKNKFERIIDKYNLPKNKKYIFSLCTLEPRKNLIMVVKSFISFIKENDIDNLVILLGGGHWYRFIDEFKNAVNNIEDYKNKIIRLGYVDDDDLACLYSNSEFFVYTSLYEGFGLPVLEAMKCGVPVITSNSSSLPEVVNGAGIMINPESEKEHVNAYKTLYYNNDLRAKLSTKGLKRAALFSWCKTVNIIVDSMKEKIADNPASQQVSKTEKKRFNYPKFLLKKHTLITLNRIRHFFKKIYFILRPRKK